MNYGTKLPRVRCPCCRGVITRKNTVYKEYTMECVECHWQSKIITGKNILFQSDLDQIHKKEVEGSNVASYRHSQKR